MFFDNLKKKQQDQSSKNWCTAETFMSLTISNLRISVFCSENTKLQKQILNNMSFVIAKKYVIKYKKAFSNSVK